MSGAAPNVRPDRGFTPEDLEAQRAARDAVMKIPPFPELQTRLTRVLGPGAERDMLHQLVYWFSKPKMQSRWWAYKTFQEWRDERGLNRKQVDKARARLRPRGVLEEKYGPHKRIHYRLDWVRLAELLLIPLKGVQSVIDPPLGDAGVTDPPLEDAEVTDPLKRYSPTQENTQESISRENKQDNPLLQSGGEPAYAEPPPRPKNEEVEPQEVYLSPPVTNERHSRVLETPKPKLAKEVEHKVWGLIFGLPNETATTRLADLYITARPDAGGDIPTAEQVAEIARKQLGGNEPLEAYIPFVKRCLGDKRMDVVQAEEAS